MHHALPIMVVTLCTLAIAYRFYSAFIAARVLVLDDTRTTPAHRLADGKDFVPTNKWVLFGHHFAAITGAGPLIGPVLAAQFGRSEEHTSELQSHLNLVCRLLLEKTKKYLTGQ